jgi:hypothetical protein
MLATADDHWPVARHGGLHPRPDRRAERPCRVHRYIGQSNPYMDIDLAPVVDNEESAVISPQIIADNNA